MAVTASENNAGSTAAPASASASKQQASRQIPIVCPGHTRPLAELQFCQVPDEPSRTLLVSACHDRLPMIRDGLTGDWIGTFSGHKGAVWSCQLDPATACLAATASGDFSVRVWDAVTGKCLWQYGDHKHIVKTVAFCPTAERLATGGHEGLLRVYRLKEGEKAVPMVMDVGAASNGGSSQAEKKVMITKCSWLTETVLLTGCADGAIRVWGQAAATDDSFALWQTMNTQAGAEIRDMEIVTVTTGSAGRKILSVAAGSKVCFFDLQDYSLIKEYKMPIHFREEGGVSLHPSGTKFVAGGSDLWVRVFDFASGEQLECLKGHHGPIRCVRYSPDGKSYATGSEDGTIRLWQTDQSVE